MNAPEQPLLARADSLFALMRGRRFLESEATGGAAPFYILPHSAAAADEARQLETTLAERLRRAGVGVLQVNLHQLALQLLRERGILQKMLEKEAALDDNAGGHKAKFTELLQGVLSPDEHLRPAILQKMQEAPEYHILMISGVGEVFPYWRAHTVFGALESSPAARRPALMFFPGAYSYSREKGASLRLFGQLQDTFYRAFNIFNCEA